MPASLKMRHGLMAAGVLALALYQNCAQAPDDGSSNSASSYEENLPFAYDAKIDTIGYMSCSEMRDIPNLNAYFSLRASAFTSSQGGLGMTSDFRSKTAYYTNTERGNLLQESNNNSNTFLTLSIRSRTDLQTLWATDQVSAGGEVDTFLPELDAPEVAGPLASLPDNTRMNYFPSSGDKRLMEASLRFMKLEDDANKTRNQLSTGNSLLVVGFTKTADYMDPALRTPLDYPDPAQPAPTPTPGANTKGKAFGTGFLVPFGLPEGYLSGDRRVIAPSGLQEIDLATGKTLASSWDCSQSYEFMVVRPQDRGSVTCLARVDRPANATQAAALSAIRRVLRVEDWFVDLDNRCVFPKGTADYCYGNTLGTRTIQYGISQCVDSQTTTCPHFVSVCIRR